MLQDFVLAARKNQRSNTFGIDSKEGCSDPNYFDAYPFKIEYKFNSRGYRDTEWPETLSELQNSAWCIGDSQTMGIGCPLEHTWVWILQHTIKQRCINVSMQGASTDWITRKTLRVLDEIKPKLLIIHYGHFNRGELDKNVDDEDRRAPYKYVFTKDIINNLIGNIKKIESAKGTTRVIHCFGAEVFDFFACDWDNIKGTSWPTNKPGTIEEFNQLDKKIVRELKDLELYEKLKDYCLYHKLIDDVCKDILYIPEIHNLDFSRDKQHYDKITATKLVNDLLPLIKE
jgi:hypothetical protein